MTRPHLTTVLVAIGLAVTAASLLVHGALAAVVVLAGFIGAALVMQALVIRSLRREEQRARADALLRETLAIGADASLTLHERLRRMAFHARRTFGAERGWIATGEAAVPGLGHTLVEECDPRFPGVAISGETVPLDALFPQVDALTKAGKALLFCEPFPELGEAGRDFLARYQVRATAQVLAQLSGDKVHWLIGLDFCSAVPSWGPEEAELLQEFGHAAALVIESSRLFEAVEQAKRELETLFDSQRDGVAMLGAAGEIVRCNRAYAVLLGSDSPNSVLAKSYLELLGGVTAQVPPPSRPSEGRTTLLAERPDGVRWLESTVVPVAGSSDLFLHVVRDITEQRLLSDKAAQKARLESLGTLAGGVAHEFNNTLMAMTSAVERLRHASSTDPEAVEAIAEAVERAGQVTRRMLALSRQQAGFVGRAPLAETLHDVVAVLRSTLPRNIRVELNVESGLGWVGLEAGALHSVLLNLATNSRDAMPDGGTLRFSARTENLDGKGWAAMEVTDTGVGIPATDLPRIFDPFFTTKAPIAGTGLGLALVHRLVSEAGGSIAAQSAGSGKGATFVVRLPLVAAVEASSLGQSLSPVPRLDGVRVLLVEDEEAVRDGVAYLLRASGAEVGAFSSAEEGLAAFGESPERFDTAVVDFGLPGVDGCSLLGELLDVRPDLVAVLASGYTSGPRVATLEGRGVRFFQKPYEVAELIRFLAAHLAAH